MNPQNISGTRKTSRKRSNARNDYSTKTLPSADGEVELKPPRARDGSFSHNLFEKTDVHYTHSSANSLALHERHDHA
ncbi:hypothetical protein F6T13_21110 [Escherichia coli]|nr:hypothetical protein [Escherichia coli]EGF7412901.1 hypothetical protein [Escherichia coli]EGF7454049.1 hypothetical protein [Escherichia coli]